MYETYYPRICPTNPNENPLRFGCIFCRCLYAVCGSYRESKRCLLQYRQTATMKMNRKVATIDGKEFDSEWNVVKHGAYKNFCERFWNALIFPFNVCIDAVPHAVMWMNPDERKIE